MRKILRFIPMPMVVFIIVFLNQFSVDMTHVPQESYIFTDFICSIPLRSFLDM